MSTKITGVLKENGSNRLLSGLYVEVYNSNKSTWMGGAKADMNGRFSLYLREDVPEWDYPLTLVVYRNNIPYHTEQLASSDTEYVIILSSLNERAEDVTHEVEDTDRDYFIVYGKLTDTAGIPLTGATLRFSARSFRTRTTITFAETDNQGAYTVKIARASLNVEDSTEARSLLVEALDGETIYATSGALFNVPLRLEVNLKATEQPTGIATEYAKVLDAIYAVDEATVIAALTATGDGNDADYLSKLTGVELAKIVSMIVAYQTHDDIGLNEQIGYALYRLSECTDIGQVLHQREAILQALVTKAIDDNIISELDSSVINENIDLIKSWQVDDTAAIDITTEDRSLEDVFSVAFAGSALLPELITKMRDFTGDNIADFWAAYDPEHSANTAHVQKGLQLLAITGMQPEITKFLLNESAFSTALEGLDPEHQELWGYLNEKVDLLVSAGVHELATWEQEDFEALINAVSFITDSPAMPKVLSPEGSSEDIPVYAAQLKSIAENLFPATAMRAKIYADSALLDTPAMQSTVVDFLSANPSYDFRLHSIHDINDTDFSVDSGDVESLQRELAPFQRIARMVGANPAAIALFKQDNMTSAQAIVTSFNPTQFAATYASVLGSVSNANAIYNTANAIANFASNVNVSIDIGPQAHGPLPAPYSGVSAMPQLSTMFGSLEMCSCEYCMSVYSPSAYFVDIMKFLRSSSIPGHSAYLELKRRRPDLRHIDMTCKNANTPVPYIDLVNEVLEKAILRHHGDPAPKSYQTNGKAAEIAAHPEHVYRSGNDYLDDTDFKNVYDEHLKDGIYPYVLPFNLALEETRTYLKHLGYSRYELMNLYKPVTPISNTEELPITELNLINEAIGISREQYEIISREFNTGDLTHAAAFYGLSPDGSGNVSDIISPTDTSLLLKGNWLNVLSGTALNPSNAEVGGLDVLLHQLKISYKELLQLLTTDFLNPETDVTPRPISIVARTGFSATTCVLQELRLEMPTSDHFRENFFDRLHRFVRFQRLTGLGIYELDTLLRSIDAPADDLDTVTYLQAAKAIYYSRRLKIPIDQLVAWWSAKIDTKQYVNYDSEHQDKIPSVYDRLFNNKTIKNPPDAVFNDLDSTTVFSDHISGVVAATGTSEKDLNLLLSELGISGSTPMSVENLTQIYRETTIAKGLGSAIKDYLRVYNLSGLTLAGTTPVINSQQGLLDDLIKALDNVQASRFTLDELEYLVKDQDTNAHFTPAEKDMLQFYEELRTAMATVALSDKTGDNADNIIKMMQTAMLQKYAGYFNLNGDITEYLLTDIIKQIAGTTAVLDLYIDPAFYESTSELTSSSSFDADAGTFTMNDMFDAFEWVNKAALLANKLKLKKEHLKLLQDNHTVLIVLDLKELLSGSANTFAQFMNYINWIRFRDQFSVTMEDLATLFTNINTGTQSDWIDTVKDITNWDADFVDTLVGIDGELNVSYPADFANASLLMQMSDIYKASATIGLLPQQLKRTVTPDTFSILWTNVQLPDSEKIIRASKSKYGDEAWLKIAKPLRDVLREKQRVALVAYLLSHPHPDSGWENRRWRDENDLYAYLLIDVEMSACMKTSRTKQAISSVQLFMDRVIMNLEHVNGDPATFVKVDEDTIKQWKAWRKWYRIWEANRKIFLYPENWIEPDLRDGKSPIFKEMETRLLQDDVTPQLVEDAYMDYLEQLDGVARLEPVTAYYQQEAEEGKNITHVVARTHSEPHIYYYRTLQHEEWSPWEKINLDIKGDHVTMVMWNRRLYLFWLTFTEKKYDEDDRQALKKENNSWTGWMNNGNAWSGLSNFVLGKRAHVLQTYEAKYWNVYLNWSEYKDNKWQPTKISKDSMELVPFKTQLTQRNIQSYSDGAKWTAIKQTLTKNGELDLNEVFKNRLYLTSFELAGQFYLSLAFSGGLEERISGLHAFVSNDSFTDFKVLRDGDCGINFFSPSNTVMHNMKYVQSPVPDKDVSSTALILDRYGLSIANNIVNQHYVYSANTMMQITGNELQRKYHNAMLNQTPNGRYSITAKGRMEFDLFPSIYNPMLNHFFFEDKVNTYFVRIKPNWVENIRTSVINDMSHYTDLIIENQIKPNTIFNVYESEYYGRYQPQGEKLPLSYDQRVFSKPVTGNWEDRYYFQTFYHPHIHKFMRELNKDGIDGLMDLSMQVQGDTMYFNSNYQPTSLVHTEYPTNIVDFSYGGTYSCYNWELFFHVPMMIAQRLSDNQQFEEAQKWYHYVFDPTSNKDDVGAFSTDKKRFWRFRPFYIEAGQQITTIQQLMEDINQHQDQIQQWEENPFKPHVIARLRKLAYMKNVVMKYMDNLIAWGDQLFRRDTIESINEATQLYILAANILGERPQEVAKRADTDINSFYDLIHTAGGLDAFSNASVEIENFIAPNAAPPLQHNNGEPIHMLYFCVPDNDKLLGYWDTIADRLFKIRNCRNIEGIIRELPLFEPPIDPALLVKAAAAGISMESVLDNVNGVNAPFYRFNYVLQKANELCAEVRGLGSAVLSALEKKDAEALALLRSGHELKLLEKVREVKEAQVSEAEQALEGVRKTKEVTQLRQRYYSTRKFMNSGEQQHLQSIQTGMVLQGIQGGLETVAGFVSIIPQFHGQATFAVGPSFGGQQVASALRAVSAGIGIAATINSAKGNMASVRAGYERRMDDWTFQAESAAKELEQIDKQILSAEIRLAIAKRELSNHELQMENSREADEFMRSKFTNKELYNWMLSQLASVYFQSYQLAYDLAIRTEKCYDFDLPLENRPTSFISFGYWDSLKKGLLAGEKLQYDLRKMEASYMEKNKRTLELTKHISLAITNPEALLTLREEGTCGFDIGEWLFDLDFPAHYYRRIKSVSVSIPCVAGPYTTIGATLQLGNSTIYDKDMTDIATPHAAVSAIATSNGQNDSGMFELNFRDERHLPFEGAGVDGHWTINMMEDPALRQFDYSTISDVILHVKYTAYEDTDSGAGSKKALALDDLKEKLAVDAGTPLELPCYFTLRHGFSQSWNQYAVLAGSAENPTDKLGISLKQQQYPFFCQDKTITINSVIVQLKPKLPFDGGDSVTVYVYDAAGDELGSEEISLSGAVTNSCSITLSTEQVLTDGVASLKFRVEKNSSLINLNTELDDIYLVTNYTLS